MAHVPAATRDQIDNAAADIVGSREMTSAACWQRLSQAPLGRVALVRHGRPLIFPVNHVTDGHTVVFCTGTTSALGSLSGREPVAFEVDDGDPSASTGWSVLVTGEIERLDRHVRARIDPQPLPWAPGRFDVWIRIVPMSVTGVEISRRRRAGDHGLLPNMAPD
jgi:uncharacterized protein